MRYLNGHGVRVASAEQGAVTIKKGAITDLERLFLGEKWLAAVGTFARTAL